MALILLAGILLSLPNFLLAKQKGVLLMNYKDESCPEQDRIDETFEDN